MQKGKQLSDQSLQIIEKRKEAKRKGEKERYTHLDTEIKRIAKIRKSSSVININK